MNNLKTLFFCLILFLNLNAKDLEPNFSLIASGAVTDLVLKEEKLYVATTASSLDIFDINTKEKIDSITDEIGNNIEILNEIKELYDMIFLKELLIFQK